MLSCREVDGRILSLAVAGWEDVRPLLKASSEPDGSRWITVHPRGPETPGHPVLIRPVPGQKGVYHVVGGAGGKLNGLRLVGVKDPATYAREMKDRRSARLAEQRARQTLQSPEERTQAKAAKEGARDTRRYAERAFIDTVLGAQGVPKEHVELPLGEDTDEKTAALAQAKHHRELLAHALRAAKDAEKKLLLDADIRTAAGLQQIGPTLDNAPGLDIDAVLAAPDSKGSGYDRALRARAEAAGLTGERLAGEVQQLREAQLQQRVDEGRFSDAHVHAGQGDPLVGLQILGAARGEAAREAHLHAKALKDAHAQAIRKALQDAVTQNEQLGAILRARKALREAYAATRNPGERTFLPGFPLASSEKVEEGLVEDLHQRMLTRHVQGFLDEVEGTHPLEESLNPSQVPSEEGLHALRGTGAFDALHEAALAALGQGVIEREAVEVLGPEGAAQVTARAFRGMFTPEEQAEILTALEEQHLREQAHDLPAVTEEARRLRAEAHQVQADLARTPRDLAVAAHLQRNRLALLQEARRTLGGTLGRLEARAALIAALGETPRDTLTVPMGRLSPEQALLSAHALGLQEEDFSLEHENGEGLLTLHRSGMDRLVRPVDPAMGAERELALAIKRGQLDREGWLPAGFARRSASRYDNPLMEPPLFRRKLDVFEDAEPFAIREAIEDHVGERIADGERPADILTDLMSATTLADRVPESLWGPYLGEVQKVFPLREVVRAPNGKPLYERDREGHLVLDTKGAPIPKTRLRRAEEFLPAFQRLAERTLAKRGLPGGAALHAQSLDADHPDFHEALHRTLAEAPRTQAAFLPVGELTSVQQGMVRDFFYREIAKKSLGNAQEAHQRLQKALEAIGPEPEKFDEGGGLFGDLEPIESPIWQAWRARRQAVLEQHQAGASSPWADYVQAMGGLKEATHAVQDTMRTRFLERFKAHHERLTGHGLKTGALPIRGAEAFLSATGTEAQKALYRQTRQQELDRLRQRDLSGRYAAGTVKDQLEEARARKAAAAQAQGSLFGDEVDPDGVEGLPKLDLRPGERMALGERLENQIRAAMPTAAAAFSSSKPVDIREGMSMSGRFVNQQRAVKAITRLKRLGLFYGAGSGKTAILLGALGELHQARHGHVKAILAVPSIVQAQFGAEAIRLLDPKAGIQVHARPGAGFEERLQAYRDPGTHAVVVTHQALRDDSLKVLAQHRGEAPDVTRSWVKQAAPKALAEALKAAWAAHGVDVHALMVDEGHDALNRKGKPDSTLARLVDANGHAAERYVGATGSPVKNDASEAFDWLHKIDPDRYPPQAREEFLRRFGVDTALSRRSLKLELSRYFFAERVHPGVGASHRDVNVGVSPEQQAELDRVEQASAKLQTRAPDSMKWARQLAPEAFEGKAEADHAPIAEGIRKAVGTFREAAQNRILHVHPSSPKIAEHIRIARDRLAEGKPVVIFAHNLQAVETIHQGLEAAGIRAVSVTGKDSAKEKAGKVARFQPEGGGSPEADVIVLSDAGATGVNLQRGKVLIHHDQPMTYKTHEQRSARIHRLGQTENVEIINLLADHSFDRAARDRVKRKEVLANLFQSPEGYLDDSGLAERLAAVRARRNQTEAA
ncbi:MAG: hypothetical protein HYZ13_09100 [Acidobacteria bacterium]|nr:hypothetical protein [Acidobacteriota bacterium]